MAADPDLVRQTGGADLSTDAAAAEHIARHLAPRGPRSYAFAVVLDGRAVGNVGIGAVDDVHATAWMSYWLAAEARGRGLAPPRWPGRRSGRSGSSGRSGWSSGTG